MKKDRRTFKLSHTKQLKSRKTERDIIMNDTMGEKRYLKWYNKLGYGMGELGSNFVYTIITSFVLIYLTDIAGMNAGIVGTLMAAAKLLDGVTDVFFGNLIDRTHTKMGKARPWMLIASIGLAVCLILDFTIPPNWDDTAKYAYFFIVYVLLNAVFYTANGIAYASLTSLVTTNGTERVHMSVIRSMVGFAAAMVLSSITMAMVNGFGGGVAGWRTTAIIYAVLSVIFNAVAVFSVRELIESELGGTVQEEKSEQRQDKIGFVESIMLLLKNKYFVIILFTNILVYVQTTVFASVGVYYTTYSLGNPNLLGMFVVASMLPMVVSIALTPAIIKKAGSMYKANFVGYVIAVAFMIIFMIGGYMHSMPVMIAGLVVAGLGAGPLSGDGNALTSAAADYTYYKTGKRIEGSMFSCTSLGVKLEGGLGTAMIGWILEAGGYDGTAAVQTASAVSAINFMFLVLPLIVRAMIMVLAFFMKVEKDNQELREARLNLNQEEKI
jgi:GPH family glycoside/pentoside/hexuronide:cation symporter